MKLVFPEVPDAARLDLRNARHPLLLLDSADGRGSIHFERVVPSDLVIAARRASSF